MAVRRLVFIFLPYAAERVLFWPYGVQTRTTCCVGCSPSLHCMINHHSLIRHFPTRYFLVRHLSCCVFWLSALRPKPLAP